MSYLERVFKNAPAFEWTLEKWVYYPWRVLLCACPFQWVIESGYLLENDQKDTARAVWVITWTAGLILVWRFNPVAAWLCVLLASIRLYEIYITGIGTILNQRQMARARNVLTIVFYVIQAVFIFAILGQCLEPSGFVAGSIGRGSHMVASRPGDFLFIGWSNLFSLGNDFNATTSLGRFLEAFATTTGFFLLSVLLAFGIEEVQEPRRAPDEKSPR